MPGQIKTVNTYNNHEGQLDKIVEETRSATKRSTRVLLLLTFATIISFSAYWNSRSDIASFLALRNINTKEELEFIRKVYFNNKEDTFSVQIPILGITFDINDLGLFSGITLILFLTLLWFCLERECENLRIAFDEAHRLGELPFYYKLWELQLFFKKNADEWQIEN